MTDTGNPTARSGVFGADIDAFFAAFNASISVDKALAQDDINLSKAHVRMLAKQGILDKDVETKILAGLDGVAAKCAQDAIVWREELEDIHMHLEATLIEDIGDAGKLLHTARSRNDQVATSFRMYLRRNTDHLHAELLALREEILTLAQGHTETIMPGLTHLQSAQPIVVGHHLHAWSEMLGRDSHRISDWRARMNVSPLGAAALAGTPHPIDPEYTAEELGFDTSFANSLDAVSDRDFVMELASVLSITMVHLSRFSEEVILWVSPFWGWASLSDSICSGSSIMPQKRNPDLAELVRGRTGSVIGALMGILTVIKAQPLAYNKDMQEDKDGIIRALVTVTKCVKAWRLLVSGLDFNIERLLQAAAAGQSTATDLADKLVNEGVPFREAHFIVGQVVRAANELGIDFNALNDTQLKAIHPTLNAEMMREMTVTNSVRSRQHKGATAPKRVQEAIAKSLAEVRSEAQKKA